MAEEPWHDEETLRKLYHGKGMSQADVGEKLGCSQKTVQRWMDKHDIPIKDARGNGDLSASDTPCPFYTLQTSDTSGHYEFWHCDSGRVRHHRLLAVAEFGFEVVKDKDVHHRNSIPWDNRPDNIELMTRSEHMGLEQNFRKQR